MNAAQYCGEYAHETKSGRISFTKKVVNNFIDTYTHLNHADFTDEMRERLKTGVMIDLYNEGISKYYNAMEELPADKIEIPPFVFGITE